MEDYNNEKIAKHIFGNILQRSIKALCWGICINSICVIDKGVQFDVMAQAVHGQIKIQYQDWNDAYQVTITPSIVNSEPVIIEDILQSELVSVIDGIVQYDYGCENIKRMKLAEAV